MPRTRRSFSPQFKAQTVLDLLTGVANQAEICRQHRLFDEESQPSPEQARIADLEQLVAVCLLKAAPRLI
jgi:hypothetical protein